MRGQQVCRALLQAMAAGVAAESLAEAAAGAAAAAVADEILAVATAAAAAAAASDDDDQKLAVATASAAAADCHGVKHACCYDQQHWPNQSRAVAVQEAGLGCLYV